MNEYEYLLVSLILVGTLVSPLAASPHQTDGQIRVTPDDPGVPATHTIAVAPASELIWAWFEIRYPNDAFAQPNRVDVVRVGIDRGDDNPFGSIDVNLTDRVEAVVIGSQGRRLVFQFTQSPDVSENDELIVTISGVENPSQRTVVPVGVRVRPPSGPAHGFTQVLSIGPDRPFLRVPPHDVPADSNRNEFHSTVYVPDGGFVTVEIIRNGTSIGRIGQSMKRVGQSGYLSPGAHLNVNLTLHRRLRDGDRVLATLYNDTNDNQQFDSADRPYKRNGTSIQESGNVTVTSIVTVDPTTAPTSTPSSTIPTTQTSRTNDLPLPGFTVISAIVAVIGASVILRLKGHQ